MKCLIVTSFIVLYGVIFDIATNVPINLQWIVGAIMTGLIIFAWDMLAR